MTALIDATARPMSPRTRPTAEPSVSGQREAGSRAASSAARIAVAADRGSDSSASAASIAAAIRVVMGWISAGTLGT